MTLDRKRTTEGTIGMAWTYITASASILSVFEDLGSLKSDVLTKLIWYNGR